MSAITQCPQCGTRFKISQEQIEIHQGMVRCGRCQDVFNAQQYLHDDEPSPQLSLPIAAEDEPGMPDTDEARDEQTESAAPAPFTPIKQAQHFFVLKMDDVAAEQPEEQKRRWPLVMAALLLSLALLAQALYFFRVEIAARLPGLKPALVSACLALNCDIPLPQQAEQLSIESSDLELNPTRANVITLNATLRNNASYAQTYPHLELTLSDTADQVMARRSFAPQDYLRAGENEKQGLNGRREASIKLHLDISDLKASGYVVT